jgi:hypothetical protein
VGRGRGGRAKGTQGRQTGPAGQGQSNAKYEKEMGAAV